MKDPYAPGFWAAVTALGLLTTGYFYGVRQLYQLVEAMHFMTQKTYAMMVGASERT